MTLGELWRRLQFLFHRERFREDLEEEMRLHRELRGSNRAFGNPGVLEEQSRDVWGARWLDTLSQDLHYGVRTLAKAPGFTVAAVLTLALAIGANTAVFSVVNGVLLHPLPFANADRLVMLAEQNQSGAIRPASYPTFLDWQGQASAFTGMAFVRGTGWRLTTPDGVQNLVVSAVTPGFFDILEEHPLLGRVFTPDEERMGAHVVVLSYALWTNRFGGDSAILGKSISVSPGVFTIVGVLPHDLSYPPWSGDLQLQLYTPLTAVQNSFRVLTERGFHADSRVIARLKPAVALRQANSDLDGIARREAAAYPAFNADWTSTRFIPLRDELLSGAAPQLAVLLGAVSLVLLIACANVANLTLARSGARGREIAIRTALGAGRGRVVRQLLTESLILAAVGAGLGVLSAIWAIALLKRSAPTILPRLEGVHVNGAVLAFTTGLTVVVTVLVGLAPALRATSLDLTGDLKDGAGSGIHRARQRLRNVLVTGEVALAMILVVGAGLLVRSLWALRRVDPGFSADHLIVFQVAPPPSIGGDLAKTAAFYEQLEDLARALPGAGRVALANFAPLGAGGLSSPVEVPGRTPDPERDPEVLFQTVSPGYFATMGIPIREGREFATTDLTGSNAVVVNQAFVEAYLSGGNPIGRGLVLHKAAQGQPDFGDPISGVIVGVAGNVHHFGLDTPPEPQVYVPFTTNVWGHMALLVRTRIAPETLLPTLRQAVHAYDPDLILSTANGEPVADVMDATAGLAPRRFDTALLGSFAGSALVLAVVGIYGLLAYSISRRRREIGIRIALGASRAGVIGVVVSEGMRLVGIGLLLGAVGALLLTRLLAALLYGVQPTDPVTFVTVACGLAFAALAASAIPARRAASVDPMLSLRAE